MADQQQRMPSLVQPVQQLSRALKPYGVPLLVDAAQTAGILDVSLSSLGADMIAMPGHKGLLGPHGTGVLVLGRGMLPRPLVVGCGPAGLFAALALARAGLRPLLIERGRDVDTRRADVNRFWETGRLDPESNVQFGEGGAGTFSDGKLTTGTKSPQVRHVLETFVRAGAPEEVLWQAKPHIGTDLLPGVVRALRERIVAAGGEVRFHTQLVGLHFEDGLLAAVDLQDVRGGATERLAAQRVVLACGHSARDTFELVRAAGVAMERKPFSVGVRIEHRQRQVDQAQYGGAAQHPALGAADYRLAVHLPDGRGVYTFCMCPGGTVVAAASEEGGVCTNGMSRFARDGENANSALLVDVRPDDLEGDDVLAGVALQRRLERAAYRAAREAGGAAYAAPAQTVGDFQAGRPGAPSRTVRPTYPRGVVWCDLRECLPPFVSDALVAALPLLDAKLRGFADADAVMTGVETRSSSPVRIVRDGQFQARLETSCASGANQGGEAAAGSVSDVAGAPATSGAARGSGLYPCGEGAGYAGGIMSAAVDGLRVAEALARAVAEADPYPSNQA